MKGMVTAMKKIEVTTIVKALIIIVIAVLAYKGGQKVGIEQQKKQPVDIGNVKFTASGTYKRSDIDSYGTVNGVADITGLVVTPNEDGTFTLTYDFLDIDTEVKGTFENITTTVESTGYNEWYIK